MKKVTIQTNEGIDWSKPQWLITQKGTVVLTTGGHSGDYFTGTALPCDSYPKGDYDTKWLKKEFYRPIFDIPFTISNSNNED